MTAASTTPRESQIVGTTHLLTFPTGDHSVVLVLMNDGLQARTPGMTPDQAEALAAQLVRTAQHARVAAASAIAASAAAEAAATPPREPPRYPKPIATPPTATRLI